MLIQKIGEKAWEKSAMAFIIFFLIFHHFAFSQRLNFEGNPLNAIPDITYQVKAASCTHFNPGDYIFKVKANYENGEWSNHEKVTGLKIYPAWFIHLGFKIIMVLTLIAILYIIVLIITKRYTQVH
jgi:hypothetical protein